ncbi:hypothetical protein SMNI109538_15950 [Smaragdicoccus niigatensis]
MDAGTFIWMVVAVLAIAALAWLLQHNSSDD